MRTESFISVVGSEFGQAGKVASIGRRDIAAAGLHRFAGSIRIPVTPANRARLRELRQAELAFWNEVGSQRRRIGWDD